MKLTCSNYTNLKYVIEIRAFLTVAHPLYGNMERVSGLAAFFIPTCCANSLNDMLPSMANPNEYKKIGLDMV